MTESKSNHRRDLVWLIGLILALGTVACYWPVRHYEYVNLDDQLYVYDNNTVKQGLTWEGVGWAFQSFKGGNWNPLVWLSHMLDCQLYGATPGGHHVTNVILHTANVVLLFLVLRGMTGTLWRSALAAALFAWHPLHVESVAWISERKDVLSTLFWLLTIGAYSRYAREHKSSGAKSRIYYLLALVFFVMGLMSKAMLVTLPVVLLIMDFWPLKRIREHGAESQAGTVSLTRVLVEKVPFLMLSAAASVVAIWAQKSQMAIGEQGLVLRLENAAVSFVTYVGEFFWPVKLAVCYPYPDTIAVWRWAGAMVILAAVTWWVIWSGKERRYLAAGWFWFLVTLLPVIGLLQVGKQAQADRYTYIPYMGLGLMVSWGLSDLAGLGPRMRVPAIVAAVAGLAACVVVTEAQVEYWRNSKALYEHALKVIPDNPVAHNNIGLMLLQAGDSEAAAKHLQETVRLEPKNARAFNDLGDTYVRLNRMDEAMQMFSNAARLNPGFAQARWNLGNSYWLKGDLTRALAEMKAGVDLSPDDVEAHSRFGDKLMKVGKPGEAVPYLEMAVSARPNDGRARFALGAARLAQRDFAAAATNFKEAVRLAPEVPQTLNALAWIYATSPKTEMRNGTEAVLLAEKACSLTRRQNAEYLDTLAAAYAEAGRFAEAVRTADEALALAAAVHDTKMGEIERHRIELYHAGKPYHDE